MATKQRELQRLRQEKHDLKAQAEANMNSLVRISSLLEHLLAPWSVVATAVGFLVCLLWLGALPVMLA